MTNEFGVRSVQKADLNLIYATWLRSYRMGSRYAKGVMNSVFFPGHSKVVERILKRPSSQTLVAHLLEDPDVVLGYMCLEKRPSGDVVHYVFVKEAFRRMGIAKALIAAAGLDLKTVHSSHWTFALLELPETYQKVTYNPYLL